MQDLHSIPGAPSRFFPGVAVADNRITTSNTSTSFIDRRLRPHPHQQNLKCPRCDSPNTKFCYYNNYNLSQPRHFCKSCRRYWTKGGILRNVPVGGGCRKSKRSSSSSSSTSSKPSKSSKRVATPPASLSSSDSAGAASDPNPVLDQPSDVVPETTIFPESSLFENNHTAFGRYNFVDLSFFQQIQPCDQSEVKVDGSAVQVTEEMRLAPEDIVNVGYMDQTVPVNLPPLHDERIGNPSDLTGLDWQGCLDPTVGIFDPNVVGNDHGLLWDLSSYLP